MAAWSLLQNGPNEELQAPPLAMVLGFGEQQCD
jgi:hypothetical protein